MGRGGVGWDGGGGRGGGEGGLKLVLLARNISLNFVAVPDYNICLVPIRVLYMICETL